MEDGWSVPADIGRIVGKLRFYLGNSTDSNKFKGTLKMLDLLEEKRKLLHEENLQRVSVDRAEEMGAWLQQVKEAADDAEALVKDMEPGESAVPDVTTWFHSDSSNLLRMKYTIGRLVIVCTEGESMLGMSNLDEDVRGSTQSDSSSMARDHAYVVGRDKEIAMILEMILDDAHFKTATSPESWASAEILEISQKGWITETLRNINISQQRHRQDEEASYQKEMAASIEYTRVDNNTVSEMMNPMIIPIVGISGVGKTTLAQFIFNDKRVQKHFQGQSAWVYFTENIRKEELMTEIFVALQPQHKILADVFDLNSLYIELQDFIEGKKFLLVLDDVSDEICAIWNDLRNVLNKGAPGSVVLVTTQNSGIASFMGTATPIFLDFLQCDNLWNLLKYHVFASDQSAETLEPVGRKIADKLHGFPLAATMIGSSLRCYLDEVHWDKILKSWWWNISSNRFGVHIAASLGVCYCELPAYLRQCLVYCSIFPRNYVFRKCELIHMWIANGIIELNNPGSRSLEEVAAEWFDELVNRCFLQPTIWKLRYVMHDLVRDFAIALTSNEYCGVDCKLVDLPPYVRHLSIDMDNMNVAWADYNVKKLRSLMLFGGFCGTSFSKGYNTEGYHGTIDCMSEISYGPVASISEISSDTFDSISETSDTMDNISEWSSDTADNILWRTHTIDHADIILKRLCETFGNILTVATSLRLLDLSKMRASAAESCIGDHLLDDHISLFAKFATRHQMLTRLTHLRYLDFSYSGINELPDSLCSLCNLQVLGLQGCRFTQLPRSMNSLISLRHLRADTDTIALIHGIGELTKLQELHEFRVTAEDGHRITELRDMRCIQGPLCISDLQKVATQEEATEANLSGKEFVTCLDLKWEKKQSLRDKYKGYGRKLKRCGRDQKEPLREKNNIPSDISGSVINPSIAMEILECLSPPTNLQKLKIFGYPGFAFPDWVEKLRYIQVIEISDCKELQVLPPIGQLEHLRKLKLDELPSIKHVSSEVYGTSDVVFRSLEELTFESMVKWENWPDAGDREFFPKLQNLQLNGCRMLKELPFMALGIAVRVPTLSDCGYYSGTVSSYLHRLNCLTHLKVNDCSQKLVLPCQCLVQLEYLHLSDCKELCFEGGILCLNNLKNLHISSCQIITSSLGEEISRLLSGWASRSGEEQAFVLKTTILQLLKQEGKKRSEVHLPDSPAAGLTKESSREKGEISPSASIARLHGTTTITGESSQNEKCIHVMQSLTELTMDNLSQSLDLDNILCKLSALRTLCLYKVHKISALQEQWLGEIKSLQELEFSCCYFLSQLPSNLSTMSSLKKLSLQSCSRIDSLPSKGLPANLKELQIFGCSPILEARCQKEDRGAWVKIKVRENQQKKLYEFWQGWLKYEEEWVQCDAEQLKYREDWLRNEEENWLKNRAEELENSEDVWIKTAGEDWPKIAHVPYIRVNGDIIQNLYL